MECLGLELNVWISSLERIKQLIQYKLIGCIRILSDHQMECLGVGDDVWLLFQMTKIDIHSSLVVVVIEDFQHPRTLDWMNEWINRDEYMRRCIIVEWHTCCNNWYPEQRYLLSNDQTILLPFPIYITCYKRVGVKERDTSNSSDNTTTIWNHWLTYRILNNIENDCHCFYFWLEIVDLLHRSITGKNTLQ